MSSLARVLTAAAGVMFLLLPGGGIAVACGLDICPRTELADSAANVAYEGPGVAQLTPGPARTRVDYTWRLRHLCVIADERDGVCSPSDFRPCPEEPGRLIEYLVLQRRPVVRDDGTAVVAVPDGALPGDLLGDWEDVRQGCIDITSLNPPPSPAEVFSYFQRLPLPELATQHQPPGDGLSGLPVIFYTDSPTTQTFHGQHIPVPLYCWSEPSHRLRWHRDGTPRLVDRTASALLGVRHQVAIGR